LGVVVLIVLAAVWAAFLLPPILRARSEHRPSGSISDFRRQLHVLARSSPAGMGASPTPMGRIVPMRGPGRSAPGAVAGVRAGSIGPGGISGLSRSRRSVKRRRDVFVGLLVAMGGSLVLGVLPQLRVLWALHVVIDVLFVAYVATLVYLRNLAAERDMKVRFLPPQAVSGEPALLYRRSVN